MFFVVVVFALFVAVLRLCLWRNADAVVVVGVRCVFVLCCFCFTLCYLCVGDCEGCVECVSECECLSVSVCAM